VDHSSDFVHEAFTMRRTLAITGFVGILAVCSLSFVVLPNAASKAAQAGPATFLIPASDGYGVADCLSSGSDCGKVVANAYCEAQGFGRATAFGVAAGDEATGAVSVTRVLDRANRPISITCDNG
jgi:hypothetical protein